MAYVFYENGLAVNVMYTLAEEGKRAVGFKLSDGMAILQNLKENSNLLVKIKISWNHSRLLFCH